MTVLDSIASFTSALFRGANAPAPLAQVGQVDIATQRDVYTLLRRLYYGGGVYDLLLKNWRDESFRGVQELRNLQHAIVEAYVATVMSGGLPDALPMEFPDENVKADAVRAAIGQVWTWSNWSQRKQLYIRQQAMLGNAFLYVATRYDLDNQPDRVYYHLIDPEYVTDIDADERGYLTYIRTDIPVRDRNEPDREPYIEVTEWWKARDAYRRWEVPVSQYSSGKLGTPEVDESMRATFGIDFVPFVHTKAIDTGDAYGMAPIIPALPKQHELNRKETSFSAQLYRHGKPNVLLQGTGGQTAGAYAPPPPISSTSTATVDMGGEQVVVAPPGYTVEHFIANLPYASHMQGVNEDVDHLAMTDLPELNWYRLAQSGNDTSGAALQTLLKPAIARIEELRGNAEYALIRANQMALTIAQQAGLDGFDVGTIGTYEDGSYEHWFAARDVVPMTMQEEAEIQQTKANTAKTLSDIGSMAGAMREAGFSEEAIQDMTDMSGTPQP
jgi:hypothetical protein